MRRKSLAFSWAIVAFLSVLQVNAMADEKDGEQIKVDRLELAEKPFVPTFAKMDGSGKLMLESTVYVPVLETRVEKDGDRETTVTVTKLVAEIRAVLIGLDQVKIFDANWKELDQETIAESFKERRQVFRAKSDMRPMLSELKELGKDALIIFQKPSQPDPAIRVR